MARPEKEAIVQELASVLSSSRAFFLTDFRGLDVEAFTKLRSLLRDRSASYRVVKNTLAKFAVDQAGLPGLKEFLDGPTGIAYTDGDIVAPAKVLIDFARQTDERPRMKGGFAEGRVLSVDEVKALAELPPRDSLLSQVLSAIQAPFGGLVGALQALPRSLASVLAALAEQRKEGTGRSS